MPTWKTSLNEDERWKVIRYIQQIYARPVMHDPDEGDPSGDYANLTNPVELSIETLDEGKQIFTRECLVCHGGCWKGGKGLIEIIFSPDRRILETAVMGIIRMRIISGG